MRLLSVVMLWSMVSNQTVGSAAVPGPERRPERLALNYLTREVDYWTNKKHCYSCHNNGDALRVLLVAKRKGYSVNLKSLSKNIGWLNDSGRWDDNGGDEQFSDKLLARIQFANALVEASRISGLVKSESLRAAAAGIASEQGSNGSWPIGPRGTLGSPVTYGTPLATVVARDTLALADPELFQKQIVRADQWLRQLRLRSTLSASAILLNRVASESQRAKAIEWLRETQTRSGGWGAFAATAAEPFDTAIAVISLRRLTGSRDDLSDLIGSGRQYLIKSQLADGSWLETTRPAESESYAQRVSTTAWCALALLLTVPDDARN